MPERERKSDRHAEHRHYPSTPNRRGAAGAGRDRTEAAIRCGLRPSVVRVPLPVAARCSCCWRSRSPRSCRPGGSPRRRTAGRRSTKPPRTPARRPRPNPSTTCIRARRPRRSRPSSSRPTADIYFVTVMAPEQSLLSWLVGRNEPAIEFLTAEDRNGFRTPSQRRTLDLAVDAHVEQVAQYVALKRDRVRRLDRARRRADRGHGVPRGLGGRPPVRDVEPVRHGARSRRPDHRHRRRADRRPSTTSPLRSTSSEPGDVDLDDDRRPQDGQAPPSSTVDVSS